MKKKLPARKKSVARKSSLSATVPTLTSLVIILYILLGILFLAMFIGRII